MDDEAIADTERPPVGVISPDAPCDVCHVKRWERRVELAKDGESYVHFLCNDCAAP